MSLWVLLALAVVGGPLAAQLGAWLAQVSGR